MPIDGPRPDRPLVPVLPADSRELIALALNLTKGRERQHAIAREASAVAARLLEYFQRSGIVLMRPPPRAAHSNNSRAAQSDALADD